MGYLFDSLKALGTTFATIFRKRATVQFPEEIRARPERYRTSFALPIDEHGEMVCVGCLACEKICPSQVITVKGPVKRESPVTGKKRAYADDFTLDLSACIFCELCVQVCNSDAIVMLKTPEVPTYSREDLVLTLQQLLDNSKHRPASWGTGIKLQEMQEGPPRADAGEKPAKAVKEKKVAAAVVAPAAVAAVAPAPVDAAAQPVASPVEAAPAAGAGAVGAPALAVPVDDHEHEHDHDHDHDHGDQVGRGVGMGEGAK